MVVSSLLETYAAAERLFILEDTEPEIEEPEKPITCGPIRSITFDHVTFHYKNTDRDVLDDFNLSITPREKNRHHRRKRRRQIDRAAPAPALLRRRAARSASTTFPSKASRSRSCAAAS